MREGGREGGRGGREGREGSIQRSDRQKNKQIHITKGQLQIFLSSYLAVLVPITCRATI